MFRNSLVDCVKVSTKDLAFKSFEVCETRLCYQDQSVTFLCVYRPPPCRKNKLSNKMFLDEFSDLPESYGSCDRLFVLGDINFHFDSDSDVSVADLKEKKGGRKKKEKKKKKGCTILAYSNLSLSPLTVVAIH